MKAKAAAEKNQLLAMGEGTAKSPEVALIPHRSLVCQIATAAK
jgi:hypothetical protein